MMRLEEYATFVSTVRKYTQPGDLELGEAIRRAMEECIEKGILSDILTNQRAEVFAVLLETFDKELYERDLRENIRAELKAEVKEEVRAEVRAELKAEVKDEVRAELKAEVKDEVREEAQGSLVEVLKELGTPKEIIIDKIMEKFSLTKAQAEKFVS